MKFLWVSLLICGLIATSHGEDDKLNEIDTEEDLLQTKGSKAAKKRPDYSSGNIEDRGRLINDLLNGYDKRNYPTNMTIGFGISLLGLDIDEEKNHFDAEVWLKMKWSDKRLQWDEKDYNVGVLRLPASSVWLPDTTLYNSVYPGLMSCESTNTLIYPTGDVLWVPPCHLKAHCNLTLWKDPFGPQECNLKIGSWTFDGISQDLDFYNNETKADLSDFRGSPNWDVTRNVAVRDVKYYDCCTEPYVSLSFNFTIQRKPTPSTAPTL